MHVSASSGGAGKTAQAGGHFPGLFAGLVEALETSGSEFGEDTAEATAGSALAGLEGAVAESDYPAPQNAKDEIPGRGAGANLSLASLVPAAGASHRSAKGLRATSCQPAQVAAGTPEGARPAASNWAAARLRTTLRLAEVNVRAPL